MTAVETMANHVRELTALLARYEPNEYGRERIEARLEEAKAELELVRAR